MVNGINLALQFLDSFAFIVLAAAGLAIIFGIMGVINLAHGEFILIGAYATTLAVTQLGLPLVVAMVVGGAVTGLFGILTERVVISGAWPNYVSQRTLGRDIIEPLYDRLADSMVATFGLSLILTQGTRIAYGNSIDGLPTPFGPIEYGAFSYSMYRIVLAGVSIGLLVATYYLFTRTDFGMRARATIQDKETAQAMGVNTERMYMLTFGIGSALAGLTGALFAPVITMQPTLGDQFLVEAFVAVVVGGPSVVLGTALSGGVLGAILAAFTNLYGTFIGRIALLVAALIALRFLPDGITGFIEQVQKRRQESEYMSTNKSNGEANRSLPGRLRSRFEGPNTIGESRGFWVGFLVAVAALAVYPLFGDGSQLSLFMVLALLGLSLSVVWGYSGVLSFGQVVFFGIGAYAFGVVSINFATPGGITAAVIAGVLVGGLSAAILGYFMFYGGVRDVYVTIITLVSTIVLHTFMAQTAGSNWAIGEAALGGFNGMPDIPLLTLGVGGASYQFIYNPFPMRIIGIGAVEISPFYYLVLVLLVGAYLGLRALVNSDYGRVMVAVREDEDRTEMFGYDVTRVKFVVFTLGGALAGLSGVLYAARNVYIDPTVFSLLFATLPVIWVSIGGRKSLLGAIIATLTVEYLRISMAGELALVLLGTLLLVTILVLPGGFVPWLHKQIVEARFGPGEASGLTRPTRQVRRVINE